MANILWSDELQFRVDEVKRENETIDISVIGTRQKILDNLLTVPALE